MEQNFFMRVQLVSVVAKKTEFGRFGIGKSKVSLKLEPTDCS